MTLGRRSLAFLLTAAVTLAAPVRLDAQSEALALVCEAAQLPPLHLRIDYELERVNRSAAKFSHDQISWKVVIRNGPTTDFKYDRNHALLTEMITPPAPKAGATGASTVPAAVARPGPSYHCRRDD